jgi:transcriptional regulator of arginine metabolism
VNSSASGIALRRRNEIQKLVRGGAVRSQEELQQLLASRGIAVAQPTLSRDLKDLGLAKTRNGYVSPGDASLAAPAAPLEKLGKLERALREFVLTVEPAGSLVILKTPPAAAHPVARALDESGLADVIGTIAGDDTIFLATRGLAAARKLRLRLLETIQGRPAGPMALPRPARPSRSARPASRPRAS